MRRRARSAIDAGSRCAASLRTKSPIFLTVAAVVTAIAAGLTFRRATTPWASMPDADYWGNIKGLIAETGLTFDLHELLRHNNEHIVLVPKLIYAANYLLTSGSNIGLIVYSLFIGAACTALLLFLARGLLIDTPWRFLLCALLFPLAMFSAKLTHSYFLGMSGTIWLTANLFVIASAAALARAGRTQSSVWLLLSFAVALLGVLTYSTAVYALLVLLVFYAAYLISPQLRGSLPRPLLVGIVTLTILVLGLGLAYRNQPRSHPDFQFDPMQLVDFVLIYLGNALTTGPSRRVVGLVILVAGAVSIRRLISQGRIEDTLLWIILFLFAPFNAFLTGIGRLGYGVKIAATSRYQSVTAITLIATVVLVLAALPQGPLPHRAAVARGSVFIALLVCAALLALDRSYVGNYRARNERKVVAEIALRQGIEGKQHIRAATPAMAQLDRVIPVLRAARHVPFHWRSRCEEMLGRQIGDVKGAAAGRMESVSAYVLAHGSGRALELSGWAERGGAGAECVAIVDGNRKVIGAGASAAHRPDLERATGRSLGLVGWKAVAVLPQTAPVCVLALFKGVRQFVPLSNCEATVETAGPGGLSAAPAPTDGD